MAAATGTGVSVAVGVGVAVAGWIGVAVGSGASVAVGIGVLKALGPSHAVVSMPTASTAASSRMRSRLGSDRIIDLSGFPLESVVNGRGGA